jgi:hypothetical protein
MSSARYMRQQPFLCSATYLALPSIWVVMATNPDNTFPATRCYQNIHLTFDGFCCYFRWTRGSGSTVREQMRRTHKDYTPRQWGCTFRSRMHTSRATGEASFPGWRSAVQPRWVAGPNKRQCSPVSQGPSLPINWHRKGSGTLQVGYVPQN